MGLRMADIRVAGLSVVRLMADLPSALANLLLLDTPAAAILHGHPFQTSLATVACRVERTTATMVTVLVSTIIIVTITETITETITGFIIVTITVTTTGIITVMTTSMNANARSHQHPPGSMPKKNLLPT